LRRMGPLEEYKTFGHIRQSTKRVCNPSKREQGKG
jgi:hypothetical protein